MSDFLVTFPPAFDEGGTFDKSGHIDDLYAWLLGHKNRPFPSSLVPLFQNESKCENEFCMQFHFHSNQTNFHKNGFALRLALKQRHKGTRKWHIYLV